MKAKIKDRVGCQKLGAEHLNLGLKSGQAELFQEAVGNLVDAHGGVRVIAKKAKIPVRLLRKSLSDRKTYQWWVDVAKIVKALGGSMAFKPVMKKRFYR